MPRFGVSLPLLLLGSVAFAINPPASDPRAVALAAQSIAELTGGTKIADVTLTGSVTWNGSDSGTATLWALGTAESRADFAITGGTRTEIRDAQTGVLLGQWIAPNGLTGKFATHNCWTDAVWFFPALSSLAAGPGVVLSYIGQESRNGGSVQHIRSYTYSSNQAFAPSSIFQQFSTIDFYLDATTLLPTAVTFNVHPDGNAGVNLLAEVDFSNYQNVNGIIVPMHIQKFQQGNLMADIALSGASFNTGLTLSIFTVN
jgi:hypothetical protein